MGKNFSKLKNRARIVVVAVSLVLGIGIGAAVLAGLIIWSKLSGNPIDPLLYIISAASALLGIAVFVPVFLPYEKRFARFLDNKYKLNEKASTMIEFKSSDDPFAVLQREDADEKLGKLKFNPWRKWQVISLTVAVLISASALTGAFLVPPKEEYVEPEKPLTEFDKQWILAELSDLINTVEKSFIAEPLKQESLNELNSLVTFVEDHEYLSEMKIEAIKSIVKMDAALKKENTAILIGEKLADSDNAALRTLSEEFLKLASTGTKNAIDDLKASLESLSKDEVNLVADELSSAVNTSGAYAESPFTVLFKNLSSALYGYVNGTVSSVDEAFGALKTQASNEILIQSVNKVTLQQVITKLCSLFGITQADLEQAGASDDIVVNPPSAPPQDSTDPDKEDEDKDISSGGIGSGDRIYGSNDMIYNPYTNEYVPYGQVLAEYDNIKVQMIKDGRIPPDFEAFINDYFLSLSDYDPESEEN